MAERFNLIEELLKGEGYNCDTAWHPNMMHFIQLNAKNGNIPFGLGIMDGKLAIVRYSELDGDGPTAFLSITADVSRIVLAIELLAEGALHSIVRANVA